MDCPLLDAPSWVCESQLSWEHYCKEFRVCQEAEFLAESLKVELSQLRHQIERHPPLSGINGHISGKELTVPMMIGWR